MYQRTLANALADAPDFHVDLGDTFMTEKHDNRENAARQYLAQRFYFGGLCHSAPLFLVLGNHDVELALPELPLGIVPDAGAIQRLPRRLPYNKAMEMLLLGERMGAKEAAGYGLINKVVPQDQLMPTARAWASKLAGVAPLADKNQATATMHGRNRP